MCDRVSLPLLDFVFCSSVFTVMEWIVARGFVHEYLFAVCCILQLALHCLPAVDMEAFSGSDSQNYRDRTSRCGDRTYHKCRSLYNISKQYSVSQ